MRVIAIDIEVHPLALRRYLEFRVMPDVFEIRADENLGHVPVPQFVGLFGGAWGLFEV